jgi:membrane-bound lytic murein transglycosylase MltF
MQLMDSTAQDLGVTNSFSPEENISGGFKYLAQMLFQIQQQ